MYTMVRRRRRSAETNYRKRIKELTGSMPRLVVRKSNRSVIVQVIEYAENGDKILASANSKELKAMGWEPRCNIPTAYLTGLLLSKKWKDHEVILDTGLYKPIGGSVVFSAAKGAQEGGLQVKGELAMDANRISGAHIENYAKDHKDRFSAYSKQGFDPSSIKVRFEDTKKKIMGK